LEAKGYSVQNIVWKVGTLGVCAGKWVPAFVKSKDPDDWDFNVDEYATVTSLLHTPTQEKCSPSRFIVYSYNGDYGNPYGTSDLRACYRHWWSKDLLSRFWNVYLEKYGSPTVRGSYRRGLPQASQDELLRVLGRIQNESAIIVPDDTKVELLETIRQGDTGFRIAVDFHNREISKSILNMTLVTDDGQGVGSFALAKVHLDVLRMCLKGLKLDLEETVMREQVLRPLVAYNFGPDAPVPVFSLGPLEEREIEPLSRAAKNLVESGIIDATDPWLKEWLGLQGSTAAPGRPDSAPTVSRTRSDAGGPGDGNNANVQVGA
jgi:phage gp29-like protein